MSEAVSDETPEICFGQLVKGRRGVTYRPEHLREGPDESTITLLRATNIQGGVLTFEDVQFVPMAIVSASQLLEYGDIAVCMSNGSRALVGKSASYRETQLKAHTVGAFCSLFRPVDKIDREFVLHLFRSQAYQASVETALAGSAINNLKNSDIEDVRLSLPSRATWSRIATILTSLDTAIEKTEALIEKHQQIKAGLMHDLFTRGVLPKGQLRPPREQAPELYEETSHGWMPRGWEATTLRVCLAEGATNGIYKPAHLIGSGVLLFGQTALTPDRSVDPKLARRAIIEAAELQRFGVYADDILVSRVFATVEGVGQPALVPPLEEPAVFESNMMRFRVNAKLMRPRLLFEWLKTDRCRRHINRRANASNQASVNQAVLYPMVVPVPPLDEQDRMLSAVGGCAARIAEDLATLSKQRCLKIGLMQDLLTGKVPVKVPATGVPA